MTHKLVIAPPDFAPLYLLRREAPDPAPVEEALGRDHVIHLLDVMRSQYLAPQRTR